MQAIKNILKLKYQLTNYQIAQLSYLFKTLSSDISKLLIISIIFYHEFPQFLFALAVMLCLRCSTGGLHFYTYIQCLAASVCYMWLALDILPLIQLPLSAQLIYMFLCILICYKIGPVTSKYRNIASIEQWQKLRNTTCTFIFCYTIILYIIPQNDYISIGFWMIILHSFQLIVAKILKKGDAAV